jgi:ribosomal protein S12 methylthiotransferase accessory factor YcaO
MRPGEGGGHNRVAARLVFQPGRGVTEQTARVACGGFSIEVWSADLPSELRMMLSAARLALEKMLTHANHVGLYAEQISRAWQQQGNFPQALTHLALISAAFNLDHALGT